MIVEWGAPLRLIALTVGGALRLVPRALRFRGVLRMARLTAPLAVALLARTRYSGPVAGRVDATVRVLCRAMTAAGTHFDPEVRYDGPEDLAGALLISGHFPLNALVTRYLFDRGLPPAVVKRFPLADPYYWGSFVRDEVLDPSPAVLVRVRHALAAGRPVFIDIDTEENIERGVTVTTAYGTKNVSTAVFDFARRCNIPLYFACGRCEGRGLPLVYVRRIEPDADAFLAQFREQAALIV
ncbi:MAG TPA: hypothetical protein VM733_15785 [Thermoanaerobaculia bacterium]|nr:hypothetical protein [Thermoanaerobaculia bacterium]